MGNYSREACLSGAVRTVIAGGMVGYREANHAASATPAVASDFDYKNRVRDGGYHPASAQTFQTAPSEWRREKNLHALRGWSYRRV